MITKILLNKLQSDPQPILSIPPQPDEDKILSGEINYII